MKLLVDCHCFDYHTTEGINTYIQGLYSAMVKIAPDIDFYFAGYYTKRLQEIFGTNPNIHYVRLRFRNNILRLLFEFPTIIKKNKIDIAHYQYIQPPLKNCKTIITLHDILFKDFPSLFPLKYRLSKDLLFRYSSKKTDLLLTVSEYSRERISFFYGINNNKIIVTPNAVSKDLADVDLESSKHFTSLKGIDKYILYVSRIEPRKNQLALLRAYLELDLAEKGIDLVFIGRKTLSTPELDSVIHSIGKQIGKHIHILNQVSFEELKMWYRAASLFVYPSIAEGFGIPPIEAGMAEIPCICNNQTAMADFTFFEDNLIDINDSNLLKMLICKNLEKKQNLTRIKAAIVSKYDWERIANSLYGRIKLLDNKE